jgi:Ca2+-binding EF-hand superfamily protein
LIYDKDYSGTVSLDETLAMLYSRYGKQDLETKMKELFGEDLRTKDGDGELSFQEFYQGISEKTMAAATTPNVKAGTKASKYTKPKLR